jgi:phosphate transport system substrate-binding protein
MKSSGRSTFFLALWMSGLVCAQDPSSLPGYHAHAKVSGAIRIWGSAQMAELMTGWQKGFAHYHPEVKFDSHFYGAVSAIAGLYTGVADLAVSREIWPLETMAFEQVIGHKPVAVQVATGSFDVPTKSDSLEIFVHQDNPISRLTLAQLDGIFGSEHLRGSRGIRTWGDLGLSGEWAGQSIHGYGFKPDNAGALFFSDVVLRGSRAWSCHFRGFANRSAADGTRIDAGQSILEALSKDRYGIAISNLHYARPEAKALSLAVETGGPFVAPTRQNILNRAYPLTRAVYIFLNRSAHPPADRKLEEFLRYILSREGQRDVMAEGAYLPLPARIVREQREHMSETGNTGNTRKTRKTGNAGPL